MEIDNRKCKNSTRKPVPSSINNEVLSELKFKEL
jgi:hypothetical protein